MILNVLKKNQETWNIQATTNDPLFHFYEYLVIDGEKHFKKIKI